MVACDSGSGCDSGLQCVDNPHQTKTSGEAMYCSAACSTAADCPEGTSSCMDGNIAACVDGFCDYSPFCM